MVLGRCISFLITVLQYVGVNKADEITREKHCIIEYSLRKHYISSVSAVTQGQDQQLPVSLKPCTHTCTHTRFCAHLCRADEKKDTLRFISPPQEHSGYEATWGQSCFCNEVKIWQIGESYYCETAAHQIQF